MPGRRSASYQQPQARTRHVQDAPHRGGQHRRQLHQRSLSPNRTAGRDREQGGERLEETLARRENSVTDDDRFHVVGGARLLSRNVP